MSNKKTKASPGRKVETRISDALEKTGRVEILGHCGNNIWVWDDFKTCSITNSCPCFLFLSGWLVMWRKWSSFNLLNPWYNLVITGRNLISS
jgi:hypothetical protein